MSRQRDTAVGTVKLEDARTKVTEWHFSPRATTGWHRHEMDYVVVPLTTGPLTIIGPGGAKTQSDLVVGEPYARLAGVEHEVINDNDFAFTFIEIELK